MKTPAQKKQESAPMWSELVDLAQQEEDAQRLTWADLQRAMSAPEEPRERNFFDALADVFTPPEALPLYRPDSEFMAALRDRQHIEEYFRKALQNLKRELTELERGKSKDADAWPDDQATTR